MQRSTVLLLVVALSSAGICAGLWRELRAERALNAALSDRLNAALANSTASQPVADHPVESHSAMAPVAASAASPQVPAAAGSAIGESPRPAPGAYDDWQARQRRLMNDPRFREAFREQQRLQLAARRENFIRLLGFTPEQADAVIDLSIERQIAWRESNMPMASENAPQLQKEQLEAQERAYQTKLRELLGDDKSAQLRTYMDSRQVRMQVDQFRTQLTGADALRDDQVEPLITALHQEQSQMQQDLEDYRTSFSADDNSEASQRKFSDRQVELLKAAHQRMHSAAAAILSSSQLDKLDAMLKRELDRHEAQQRMARIQSKLDPPSEGSGNSN